MSIDIVDALSRGPQGEYRQHKGHEYELMGNQAQAEDDDAFRPCDPTPIALQAKRLRARAGVTGQHTAEHGQHQCSHRPCVALGCQPPGDGGEEYAFANSVQRGVQKSAKGRDLVVQPGQHTVQHVQSTAKQKHDAGPDKLIVDYQPRRK